MSLAGFAAASTINFDTTGADSHQSVELNNGSHVRITNDNNVGVANFNVQSAQSGRVEAEKNTSVSGNVGSGDASNSNSTNTNVAVNNSGSGLGSLGSWAPADTNVTMHLTGADSHNTVEVNNDRSVNVDNDNTVGILNLNCQTATSGNVEAEKNTTVGGVTSGAASNTNTTSTSVSITN